MIRYYGAYCRKLKKRYSFYLVQESISYANIGDSNNKRVRTCPICGSDMEFVMYWKKGPPYNTIFGSKIDDWRYILSS